MKKLLFSAAGAKYTMYPDLKYALIPGEEVELRFEPENIYDDSAVGIYYLDSFIGYVPANKTLESAIINEKKFKIKRLHEDTFEVKEV